MRRSRYLVVAIVATVALVWVALAFYPKNPAARQTTDFAYSVIDASGTGRVAIGDIDDDGKNDIAVHTWKGDISWYKYPKWERHLIATGVVKGGDDIQLADIDGDGDLDLVGPWRDKTRIHWFENLGQSAQDVTIPWPSHPIGGADKEVKDLHVVDLNSDGRQDVVARHHDILKLYFQIGLDRWQERTIQIVEREGMAIGDLDRDGDADVVLNGFWLEHPSDPIEGIWTRHDIDSTWYEMSGGGWRDNGAKVAVADINDDGHLDVVLSASERTEDHWPIAWYEASKPNTGPVTWKKHIVGSLANAHTLQVADFDLDGSLDILACRLRNSSYLPAVIFFNKRGGWRRNVIHEGGCYSGKVGDIDNDGDADFVSARSWTKPPLYLIRNQTDPDQGLAGNHMRRRQLGHLASKAMFVPSGDIDGDGNIDIVAGSEWWRNPGNPTGDWVPAKIGEPLRNAFAVYDFDGDGDLDILGTRGRGSTANSSFAWARNNGSGVFEVLTNIETGGAGDFLQGYAFLHFGGGLQIALSWHNGGGGIQTLTVPEDPVSQKWEFRQLSSVTQDEALSAGDIDRDGDDDLLLGTVWLRNDGQIWTPFHLGKIRKGVPDRNRLADIDDDGDLDAVVSLENGTDVYWFEAPSDPTNRWKRHVIGSVPGQGFSMDVADIDGDEDTDIVVGEHRGKQQNRVLLFLNDAKGTAWDTRIIDSGSAKLIDHHNGTQAVDIDKDGDLDLISIGWYNPKLWLLENRGALHVPEKHHESPKR